MGGDSCIVQCLKCHKSPGLSLNLFQRSSKEVPKKFHRSSKAVPQKFQRSSKEVPKKFQRSSKEVLWNFCGTSLELLWNFFGTSLEQIPWQRQSLRHVTFETLVTILTI